MLASTLKARGKGKGQAKADYQYHVLRYVRYNYGLHTICGVLGDNASIQSGALKGQAVELGKKFLELRCSLAATHKY